jgi:RNA polymerase sigma factor (sigma-70 family)
MPIRPQTKVRYSPRMSPRISIRLLARQSDRRLLELVGHGDERAFETVVQRYRPALIRYCRRLGLSEPAAEDVVQHSFTKAWLALSGGQRVNDLRPWLYRIAHNNALNSRRGTREASAPLTELSEAHAAGGQTIESSMQAREALGHVAALPDMQRDAVVLTALQGRSHGEAADALGISDGAVRGLLYRARATLRSAAAAIAPPWLLQRLPGFAQAVTPVGDVPAAGGTLGLGVAATKFGALAAGAGLLAAGVAGAGGHSHSRSHTHPARSRAVASARVGEGDAASTTLMAPQAAATRDGRSRGTSASPVQPRHRRHGDGLVHGRHQQLHPGTVHLEDAFRGAPTVGGGHHDGGGGSDNRTRPFDGSRVDGSARDGSGSGDGGSRGDSSNDGSGATLESSRLEGGSSTSGSGDGGTQSGDGGGSGSSDASGASSSTDGGGSFTDGSATSGGT